MLYFSVFFANNIPEKIKAQPNENIFEKNFVISGATIKNNDGRTFRRPFF